jgi:hypothetical protein
MARAMAGGLGARGRAWLGRKGASNREKIGRGGSGEGGELTNVKKGERKVAQIIGTVCGGSRWLQRPFSRCNEW